MVKEREEMMLRERDRANNLSHRHLTETFLEARIHNGPTDLALESSRMTLNAHHFALPFTTLVRHSYHTDFIISPTSATRYSLLSLHHLPNTPRTKIFTMSDDELDAELLAFAGDEEEEGEA